MQEFLGWVFSSGWGFVVCCVFLLIVTHVLEAIIDALRED